MKKIVALVLALVMVLGLATVASAASTSSETKMGTTTTVTAAEKYSVVAAASTIPQATWNVIAYTGVSTKVDTTDGLSITSYVPGYYSVDTNKDGTADLYLYEVAEAACATYRVFKGDAFVTYVVETATKIENTWYSTSVVKVAEGEGCGTYDADVLMNPVTYATNYIATGPNANVAILDGKFVYMGASATAVKHTFEAAATFDADEDLIYKSTTDATVVGVVCTECDKTFTVVENGKIPASYKGLTTALLSPANTYTVLLQDVVVTPSAPAAGDKVESAETFDAGIAMYVGMSVMAAAGSAVVLKKKD